MQDSAACVTVNAWPATVSVAVRAAPVLAPAVIVIVPDPFPLAGLTVSHAALLAADQPHEASLTVRPTLPLPPMAATLQDELASA